MHVILLTKGALLNFSALLLLLLCSTDWNSSKKIDCNHSTQKAPRNEQLAIFYQCLSPALQLRDRKAPVGSKQSKSTPQVLADLKSKFENQDNLSFSKAAAQIRCHRSELDRRIKAKSGIKPRRKQKSPKYKGDNQAASY